MIDPLRSEDTTESHLFSSSRLRRSLFLFSFSIGMAELNPDLW